MKLLLVGGTQFLGLHLVQAALAAGHEITLFTRGRTGSVPAGVTHLAGDRKGDLGALQAPGLAWDAVIDTCGYLPRDVQRMAQVLHGRVGSYLFVSSISVYASFERPNDETAALARIDDPDTEVIDGRTYGALKALCEQQLLQTFGAAGALVVRPGLIVGPHDPTQRFTYWPARVAAAADGDAVLLPGAAGDAVQFIDVRDLAAWMLALLHDGRRGVFNATSAPGQFTMGALAEACAAVAGTSPRWCWADAEALERLQLRFWTDLPVWVPLHGDTAGMPHTATAAAQAAGLSCRSLEATVRDTLAWWRALPAEQQAFTKAGLSPEREAAALAALRAAQVGIAG